MFALLLVSAAHASLVYPNELSTELGMPCAPLCTACHDSQAGGAGTVTQPFGMAMMDRGLTGAAQVDLLATALAAMEADAVDSDADGTLDVDELLAGEDPNGGEPFCGVLTPTYGCFNHTPGLATGVGVVLGALALRRRRA